MQDLCNQRVIYAILFYFSVILLLVFVILSFLWILEYQAFSWNIENSRVTNLLYFFFLKIQSLVFLYFSDDFCNTFQDVYIEERFI